MNQILALREKRANLWNQTKAFLDSHRGEDGMVSAADNATYEKMEADVVALGKEIERLERQAAIDRELDQPTAAPLVSRPTTATAQKQGRASDEYRNAFWGMIRNRSASPAVMNALQIGTDSEGGYLVPDEYERTLVQGLEEENVLRSLCTVIQTSSGDRKIPIVASHGTASWVDEEGTIPDIVTKSVSRFARNTVDSLTTIRQLKEKGIECYFEKENIWTFDGKGELLITIMSSLAQEESRSISENVTWGQRKRMADGKVAIPFKHTLGFKRGPKGEILVDEEQAKTVRDIYDWFLEGLTPHAIAARLMENGVPSPRGKEVWHQGTVKSILSNEKYKGDALMQKFYTEDFLTKRQIPNKGVLSQYYVEGNHEAIIPPETFELVQLELERRKSKGGRYSGVDIFASRIVCGECGAYYGSKVWHSNRARYRRVIYRCNQKYMGDKRCSTPHVTEEQLKQGFVNALNKLISRRDDIISGLTEDAEILYDTTALETEKKRLWDEMCVLAEMVQAAINENAHVALDQKEYQKRYDELATRYDGVKAEHDKVAERITTLISTKTAAQQFVTALRGLPQKVTAFNPETWGKLLDHATVCTDGKIHFTFRNGIEI